MVKKDDDTTDPATKKDVKMMMDMMGTLHVAQGLLSSKQELQQGLLASKQELHREIVDSKKELRREILASEHRATELVTLLFENLRADVLDARKDQVALHEDRLNDHGHRIVRLEHKVA